METLVIYSAPGISHLIPMVELAKLLISHNPSLSITIIITNLPFKIPSISPYISSLSSSFPSITFHSLPPIPLQEGNPSNHSYPEDFIFETILNNSTIVHNFLKSLSLTSPISAFIIDFFCYSAVEITRSFNKPTYFIFTTNAACLTHLLNFPVFDRIATDSIRSLGSTRLEIPGLFSFPASHVLQPMLDRGFGYYEFLKVSANMLKSDGIIINTFEALEPRAVNALKEGTCLPRTHIPPVYCIGPLIANRCSNENHECLSWLDLQPSKSVVYLNFGSRGWLTDKQMIEISVGLENSGVRFLWVVQTPPSDDNAKHLLQPEPDLNSLFSNVFLGRTKDTGFIVKSWAPQIAILAHEAVGGFVTHCGWNLILEAVSGGVPLVAWPLDAEQRFNKVMLVEELKIALPMDESEDRFVNSDEIERRVKQIISSEEGDLIRTRVKELSHNAKTTVGKGGSSRDALLRFMESWKCLKE